VRPWLQRNRLGLAAVVVLLPATVGITFATQWGDYFGSRPSAPTTVASGDSADFAGAGWSVEGTRRVAAASAEAEQIGLPAGSDLLITTVRVVPDGSGDAPQCTVRLEEFDGGSVARTWGDAGYAAISYSPAEGTESYCAHDVDDPYLLETAFVVPSDTGDDLALALVVVSEIPRYLSLRL